MFIMKSSYFRHIPIFVILDLTFQMLYCCTHVLLMHVASENDKASIVKKTHLQYKTLNAHELR